MKIGIVGSRKFKSLNLVAELVEKLEDYVHVVSGGARGVDTVAAKIARYRGLQVTEIKPDYENNPRKLAPIIRNTQIIDMVQSVAAFWDGESKGTEDAIRKAIASNKPVLIISPDGKKTYVHDGSLRNG